MLPGWQPTAYPAESGFDAKWFDGAPARICGEIFAH
jgi:hypothetical protein